MVVCLKVLHIMYEHYTTEKQIRASSGGRGYWPLNPICRLSYIWRHLAGLCGRDTSRRVRKGVQ